MDEEEKKVDLDDALPEEKREQLIRRVADAANNGVLRVRDWFAIYDILIEACNREQAYVMEDMMMESINGGDGG